MSSKPFVWGVATSSFQIEGAVHIGGRGESIWDRFCRTPEKVKNSDNGDIACDHFHRYKEDIALMKSLGVQAYRFSVAWPRIFPTGKEEVPNGSGLQFYSNLVDALLEAGIEPWLTLYHWDMPQPLQDDGGWCNRGILTHFQRYTRVLADALGDRVKNWITINEPWVICHLGYATGEHAPGISDWPSALQAAHHVLLAHGVAVQEIRQSVPDAKVGITLNLCPSEPASPSDADADANRHFDGFFNRWYLDPVFGRGYPEDMIEDYVSADKLPATKPSWVQDGDLDIIAIQSDFLGINYYSRAVIRSETIPEEENLPPTVIADGPRTDFDWEVHAPSLHRLLHRLTDEYQAESIIVTENGASYATAPDENGTINDEERVYYFKTHTEACVSARHEGVPLDGYFAWSLMDNFEWAEGYSQRFGLVWVDFETLHRTPKDSAYWYRDWIQSDPLKPSD